MPKKRQHILAIALTPGTAQIAQAKRDGDAVRVTRQSTLHFDEDARIDTPQAMGRQLAAHLKSSDYDTKHVVVGLCAQWMLARQKSVPPTDALAVNGIIQLQIEREFSGSQDKLLFDYLPLGDTPEARNLLLVAAQKHRVQQITQAMQTAGLVLDAISVTALALADQDVSVLIEDDFVTTTASAGGLCHAISACPIEPATLDDPQGRARLLNDITRLTMQLQSGSAQQDDARFIDASSWAPGIREPLHAEIAQRWPDAPIVSQDSAKLLAQAYLAGTQCDINFLSSRLNQQAKRRISPAMGWTLRAAAAAALIGLACGFFWFQTANRLSQLENDYVRIKEPLNHLETINTDARRASPWFDGRTQVLDCLLELTHAFPTQGQIWVTSLEINEDMTGMIKCKAQNMEVMQDYLDAMRQSPHFSPSQGNNVSETGRDQRVVTFDITFQFHPTPGRAD